jgi:hypothetical protein
LCPPISPYFEVDFVVAVFKEDGLPPIATLRDMMRQLRNDDSSESSHARTIAQRGGIGIMSPYSPSHAASVVPCPEVVVARFGIAFFAGRTGSRKAYAA